VKIFRGFIHLISETHSKIP